MVQRQQKRTNMQKQRNTKRQTQTNTNRCERCNRQLKDPTARLGWRCAEILGRTQSLNHAGDRAFDDYNRSVNDASGYLRKNSIDIKRVNLPKFYESYAKQYLSEGMGIVPFGLGLVMI